MTDQEPSNRRYWPALIVTALSLGIGYLLIVTGPKTLPEEKVRQPKSVTVERVIPGSHRISVTAYGTIIPVRQVTLESEVTGRITRLHPSLIPGGFVQAGEELFGIDDTLTKLSLTEARAATSRAEASLKESRRKRIEAQQLSDDKVIPVTQLAALEAEELIQAAERQRLQASEDRIKEMLARHVVRAPFNAVVLDETVEIGQRMNPGFPAATLVGTDAFWVRAALPLDQLRHIRLPADGKPGSSVKVFFDAGADKAQERTGRVVQLLSDMEQTGRMARILIEISNPLDPSSGGEGLPLLIGSYVRVEIDAGELANVIAIQRAALRESDKIWIVDAKDQLYVRDATVRWEKQETVYLDYNLNPDERLVVSPLRVALPGMNVRPRETTGGQ